MVRLDFVGYFRWFQAFGTVVSKLLGVGASWARNVANGGKLGAQNRATVACACKDERWDCLAAASSCWSCGRLPANSDTFLSIS